MDTSQKAVGQRLKELRKYRKLSGQAVGDLIGITKSTISLIESGANKLSYEYALIIAKHLESSVDWLLSGKGSMLVEESKLSVSYSASSQTNTTNQQGTNNQAGGSSETLRIAELEIEVLKREIARQEKYIRRLEKQLGIEEETD